MNNNRLNYLKENYSIVNIDEYCSKLPEDSAITYFNVDIEENSTTRSEIIAIKNDEEGLWRITQNTFDLFVKCDPTKKKIYVQWFLNLTLRYFKYNRLDDIKRLISEDLFIIQDSLLKFDQLKKTKRFKELSLGNYSLSNIKDPSDINQYTLIEQLHDAIFPFEGGDSNGLIKRLELLSKNNKGEIVFEDKNFIVFTPLKLEGAVEFHGVAKWCTTRPGNGMFKSYTSKRNGLGKLSKLFVIINKNIDFNPGPDDNEETILSRKHGIYQIHFETCQINHQSNSSDPENFVKYFLTKSHGLTNYFKSILVKYLNGPSIHNNNLIGNYSRAIKSLEFIDVMINILPDDKDIIDISNIKVSTTLEIKSFKKLRVLKLINMNLTQIPIMDFSKTIELISLQKNNITEFPEILSDLKNLKSINLSYNKISQIPSFIKKLDPGNGGKLLNISLRGNELNEESKKKLREYLPNVLITY